MIYNEDTVIIETEKDLTDMLSKYDCEDFNELSDALWYTYGVTLVNKINNGGV